MTALPKEKIDFSLLHDMATAPIRTKLLMAGIELGIFDELDSFRSAGEIAAAIGGHAGNTERFLNALATIGLVEKKDCRFRNGPEAEAFLVQNAPACVTPLLRLVEKMCIRPLDKLPGLVRGGPPTENRERGFESEELWAEATRASAGWVTGGAGRQMADIVSGLPEFSGFRKMLDLGGGHGMFALYIVDAHPSMAAFVFDRPAVVAVAEEFIRKYGMEDRVSVRAGDYLVDDLGEGYDLVWASATLNFARHNLDSLFDRIFNALNSGGVFISFQDGLTCEQTRPDTMLGHLGDAMHMNRDVFFEQGEIADAMLRCGFRSVRSRTIQAPMGEMDLDIARK